MDRRFALFAVLVALIFVVNQLVFTMFFAPEPDPKQAAKPAVAKVDADKKPAPTGDLKAPAEAPAAGEKPGEEVKPADSEPAAGDAPQPDEAAPAANAPPAVEPQRGSLGSLDSQSPYRMIVCWNNRGATLERVELNGSDYRDIDDRSGYLGYLAPIDAPNKGGALVRVVGAGTPAALAGMQVNDQITAFAGQKIRSAAQLLEALKTTEPGQSVELSVNRSGAEQKLKATLALRPVSLIRAEFETKPVEVVDSKAQNHDPLSFLTTIQQFDERSLADDNQELGGVNLRNAEWEVVAADAASVQFKMPLPALGLEVFKTYKLGKVASNAADEQANAPGYALMLDVEFKNTGDKAHQLAFRQDGPTGLPTEGAWFANKVSRSWGGAGLRDVIVQFQNSSAEQVTPAQLNDAEFKKDWGPVKPLEFIAVDAQYFSVAMVPTRKDPADIPFQSIMPLRAGQLPKEGPDPRLLDVSFRLDTKPVEVAAGGSLKHEFQIFAGPKRPALLDQFANATLGNLVYYGWFGVVARPMLWLLHTFYAIIGNYGIAIILLTVLVRGCMFPVSRKQALGAQKMQELQPEMKKINEKYKSDPQKRTQATQDLFRTHKYNPLGGCVLAFAQLPIFVGLYRSLMVDVELRGAPLFSESIRWASNLAAPDMFWNWSNVVPDFVSHGTGMLALGPYLNILPLFTIGLFIWQQKMFMPPPADDQAALQQKMMQYMMIFMGVLFFKVASGLCIYFIASSLWGITERKMLPKPKTPGGGEPADLSPAPSGNGSPSGRKRQRGRK